MAARLLGGFLLLAENLSDSLLKLLQRDDEPLVIGALGI